MSSDSKLPDLFRGDTWTVDDRQHTDDDGKAINITGYSIIFTLKESTSDTDADAVVQQGGTIVDAENGKFKVVVGTGSTVNVDDGRYYYDIQLESPSLEVTTFEIGTVRVRNDVTRTAQGSVSSNQDLVGGTLHTIAGNVTMTVPGNRSYLIDDLDIEEGGQFILEDGARLVIV